MCRSLLDIQYTRGPDHVSQNEAGESLRAHERIAQAIMDGEPEIAERRMRRHLEAQIAQARENRPEMLDRLIDWR
jgi:DNA-binding FadR family transcriptional regulator